MTNRTERRRFLRAAMDIFLSEQSGNGPQLARGLDICEGGLRYLMPASEGDCGNDEVMLEFRLPGCETTIRARGRVTGRRQGPRTRQASVVFTTIRACDAKAIRNYVVSRKRAELFEAMHRQHLS